MKLAAFILLALLLIQSYFYNELIKTNLALEKNHTDVDQAIQYYEEKNYGITQKSEDLRNEKKEILNKLATKKIEAFELKSTNKSLTHKISQAEEKINLLSLTIESKDEEIFILKNELLKYLSK